MVAKIKTKAAKAKSALKIKKGTAVLNKTQEPSTLVEALKPIVIPMGELSAHIKQANAVTAGLSKKYAVYTKQVAEHADVFLNDDEGQDICDGDYTLKIAAKTMSAVVNDQDELIMALEAVEEGLALKLAKFGIGDLRKYLTEDEFKKLTHQKAGSRRLVI